MDIFSELDQLSDGQASSKNVLNAGKKAEVEDYRLVLSQRIPSYAERTLGFVKRYEKFTGDSFKYTVDDYKSLANWLVEHVSPAVSKRSWAKYRLSVSAATEHPQVANILKEGVGYIRSSRPSRFNRQKHIKESQMSRLLLALAKSNSPYKSTLIDWIRASKNTGLRPNEWADATIAYPDGLTPALKVRTKIKKPANREVDIAPYRYIPIEHLSPIEVDGLYAHLRRYTKAIAEKKSEALYESCRKLLYNTCRFTFRDDSKGSIHLYSARHQFCADLKASGCAQELIIRLMGQNSTEVLTHHYAKKSAGRESGIDFEKAKKFNQ
jgi:hypothetical protein